MKNKRPGSVFSILTHPPPSELTEALRRSGLLDRSRRHEFGHLTDLVREVLDVPVAVLALTDGDRQVFTSHSGLPATRDGADETPVAHAFCQRVVDRNAPLVIPDARLDPLVGDDHATRDIYAAAYLGVPLQLPGGETVGALGAIDTRPRAWTESDLRRLHAVARAVEKEMAVRISESRWRSIFESMQEGFVLAQVVRDEAGRIRDWRYEEVNEAWYELLAMTPGTVVGRTIREILPDIEEAWVQEFANVVDTGQPIRFTRQVGSLGRWYDGIAQPIGGERFTVIFLDVTERIKRDRRQATLLTLGDELRGRSDLETIVMAAARCLADGLEVDRVGAGMVDLRDDTVVVRSDWCEPGIRSVAGRHSFASFGSYIEDLRRDEVVAIDDVYADPRTGGQVADFNAIQTRSLLNLPISFDGRLFAIVFAHSREVHPWTDGELQFVRQVGDRVRVALVRHQAEDAQRVLTQEMAHRMKNSLAMVQAIATQTLRQSATMEEGRHAISQRLGALGRAQDILTRTHFSEADVREVVEAATAPHQTEDERIAASGPRVMLTAQQALGLSLAIHELATNAAKYGALSTGTGSVAMSWGVVDGTFVFRWIETGGPLVVAPDRRGFGSRLIERIVGSYFDGEGRIDFDPAGIRFQLTGATGRPALTA